MAHHRPSHSLKPARLTILADTDYYSAPATTPGSPPPTTGSGRFIHMGTSLKEAKKTGLGSSAALVTSLTAALLSHYLHPSVHFDLSADAGRRVLHNLAQAAHCRAQGKIGSGFDVAAAVYGSCLYRRFSPAVLDAVPAAGRPDFGPLLEALVSERGTLAWDTDIAKSAVSLPGGVAMRMCDVDCGSQTVGMVKQVNAWRSGDPEGSKALWDELQRRNEALAGVLRDGKTGELGAAIGAVRELVRKMGVESGVPIEPESQTELLDALSEVEGVFGGVVPGAGGFDAVVLLVRDDAETMKRLDDFTEKWAKEKGSRVKLLSVKGELEGARLEKLAEYEGWLQ